LFNMTESRRTQMKWLLALTAVSLMPVYVLIGWQSSGHGPATVANWFWLAEAGAWGLRALVEAWALIYLFQTTTNQSRISKVLAIFEGLLIGLIALTVGLVIIANGSNESISRLPAWLFYLWSFSVAAFAPLMMGSVGYAYRVHAATQPIADKLQSVIEQLQSQVKTLIHRDGIAHKTIDDLTSRCDNLYEQLQVTHNPIVARRTAIREALQGDNPPTHKVLAELHGVSVGTIGNDVRSLNGTHQGR